MRMMRSWLAVATWSMVLPLAAETKIDGAASPEKIEYFEKHIRPVLVEHCFSCHGPKLQQSGLRLDSLSSMLAGGDSGTAIVPGKPADSLLISAIRHDGLEMPPKKKLPDEAIGALTSWVSMGAPWPAGDKSASKSAVPTAEEIAASAKVHWAFQPVKQPQPPKVDPAWVKTPVDAYVLDRLNQTGLKPSAAADKRTLIRRVYFDLIGLPPSFEDVTAFEKDSAPDAFAKVVDRLLASPQYGIRWGRHWLDIARYADTKGDPRGDAAREETYYPYAYSYRDWVIEAFNSDMPYDRFLMAQLAADRLTADKDPGSLAALGYLTVGRRFLNRRVDIIDDQIDVVTRGMLGLSVTCARCHDHKYDPISIEDYYSFHGIFNSTNEVEDLPLLPAKKQLNAEEESQAADYQQQLGVAQNAMNDFFVRLDVEIATALRDRSAEVFDAVRQSREVKGVVNLDAFGREKKMSPLPIYFVTNQVNKLSSNPAAKDDPILRPLFVLMRTANDKLAAETKKLIAEAKKPKDAKPIHPLVLARLEQKPFANQTELWNFYGGLLADVQKEWKAMLAKPESKKQPPTALPDPAKESIRQLLHAENGAFVPKQKYGDIDRRLISGKQRSEMEKLRGAINKVEASHPGSPPRAMVLAESPTPRDSNVFLRGDPRRPGPKVTRRFLTAIAGKNSSPFTDGSGRRELAEAIADPENPLTARVFVNRVWAYHFGAGLTTSPSDFGLRSDPPSHPELLDWLAWNFVREGWSTKKLHRWIVLSSTYQQKSDHSAVGYAKDPENRLLWKQNRQRLDFEAMRDSLLAASGALDATVGGKAFFLSEQPFTNRRSAYGFVDRLYMDGMLKTFDFALPDTTSPKRYITTVPQQALFAMNSPFVQEQARRLSQQPSASPDEDAKIRLLYARTFQRPPRTEEVAVAKKFLAAAALPEGPALGSWQYGFGPAKDDLPAAERFQPFKIFDKRGYHVVETLPEKEYGHMFLNPTGGHAGPTNFYAIRRWTAPADGVIEIDGKLSHGNPNGDGIRARVVAGNDAELDEWIVHNKAENTDIARYKVTKGEAIDFIVDCQKNTNSDSFNWTVTVRLIEKTSDDEILRRMTWNSQDDFAGPPPPPMSPWEQYAQALLLTNEFMFVD